MNLPPLFKVCCTFWYFFLRVNLGNNSVARQFKFQVILYGANVNKPPFIVDLILKSVNKQPKQPPETAAYLKIHTSSIFIWLLLFPLNKN